MLALIVLHDEDDDGETVRADDIGELGRICEAKVRGTEYIRTCAVCGSIGDIEQRLESREKGEVGGIGGDVSGEKKEGAKLGGFHDRAV